MSYKLRPEFLDEHRLGTAGLSSPDPYPDAIHVASATEDKPAVALVADTLKERGEQYGSYAVAAGIVQGFKRVAQSSRQWADMDADQKESIELIFTKLGRILNGNPNHKDSWHDIAGYAQLIERRLP